MGLLSEYDQRFASRLELLKANMDKVLADAHKQLEDFNADFIGIYNELHGTLHGAAERPPRPKDDPDAEAKARVELPAASMAEFEKAIAGAQAEVTS